MPVVEIPIDDSTDFRVLHVEPHRVISASDFNQLSGDLIPGSLLEQLIAVTRMMLGEEDAGSSFVGFRTKSFGGPGPATHINAGKGLVVDPGGVYCVPPLRLLPTEEAHYGHFEFSLEEMLADERSKQIYSIEREEIDNVMVPTSRRRFIRLYEKYSVSPEMTTTTPGRIRWLEYRKEAAFQRIVSLKNWLTVGASSAGFTTGDLKYSVVPGDGIAWLTCNGREIPKEFQDLINHLRSSQTHPIPLPIVSVADNGGGLCQVEFPAGTILKNIRTHPGKNYACLEILSSSDPQAFPPGTYKVKSVDADRVVIALSFAGGAYTGTASIRPYSIADEDGGGARTPCPGFIRPFNPVGAEDDVSRLPNTYQNEQVGHHDHGGSTGPGGEHTHNLLDPGHYHFSADVIPGIAALRGFPVVDNGAGVEDRQRQTTTSTTGISIGSAVAHDHSIPAPDPIDPDNPGVNRPGNLSLYLLIKT